MTMGNEERGTGGAAALVGVDVGSGGGESGEPPKPSRGRGIAVAVVVVGMVFLLGVAVFTGAGKKGLDFTQPDGEKAPDFSLDTIQGKHITFSDLRGKPVFVNFWASWCGPCKDEAPVLADAYRRWQGSGVVFLGVDESDSIKWAIAFEKFYGIQYDSAFDPSGEQYRRWGLTGYPETFLVDPQGTILRKKIGAFYEQNEIDSYLSLLAPNFTPEPPGELVIPPGDLPAPQESPEIGGETPGSESSGVSELPTEPAP